MSKRFHIGMFIAALAPCVVHSAEISFIPVRASGPHQIIGPNNIYMAQGGQRVYFDFFVSEWDPDGDGTPAIRGILMGTAVGSYGNPASPSPLAFPVLTCTTDQQCRDAFDAPGMTCDSRHALACQGAVDCCQAFFIDTSRPDWIIPEGMVAYWAVDTQGVRVGVSVPHDSEDRIFDDGTRKYIASLVLDVPADAFGEFTLTFRELETFIQDESDNEIPLSFVPAKVFIGVQPSVEYPIKPRYFSFTPGSVGDPHGYAVRLTSLHHPSRGTPGSPYQTADFSGFEGQVRWLGPPAPYVMAEAFPTQTFTVSKVQCDPYFAADEVWSAISLLHVLGAEVIPDSLYEVKRLRADCTDFDTCGWDLGSFRTGRWADVVPPFEINAPGTQPDISDISGVLSRFRNAFACPSKAQAQLQPNIPDPSRKVNFHDIAEAVGAFRGYAYPFPGPTNCP